jgi:hypothetical protein
MSYAHDHQRIQDDDPPSFWRTRYGIGLLVLGAVATYFLLTEHLAHVATFWPFAFLLACPLMHLFMHHGRGHGHGHRDGDGDGHDRHGQRGDDGSGRSAQDTAALRSDSQSEKANANRGAV